MTEFSKKVCDTALELNWTEIDSNIGEFRFVVNQKFNNIIGNRISVKYLNTQTAYLVVSGKIPTQLVDGGETSDLIITFLEKFYSESNS